MTDGLPRTFNNELPIGLIDPPKLDARIDRDPEKLDELARDLSQRGMIFPLAVVRDGDRYELVDGYRRYLAAKRADLVVVPALIYPTKAAALEGVKYAANAFREDMSPAEEAVFFQELYNHECAEDVDRLCALVNKKRSYVEGRLLLISGSEEVFEALRARQISIGVAQELNKITDPEYVHYFLTHAIRGGATVSLVSGWVQEYQQTHTEHPSAAPPALLPGDAAPAVQDDPNKCLCCGTSARAYEIRWVPVHSSCLLAILSPMLAAYRGEGPSTS